MIFFIGYMPVIRLGKPYMSYPIGASIICIITPLAKTHRFGGGFLFFAGEFMRKKSNKDFKFDFSSLDFDFGADTPEDEVQEIPKLNIKPVMFDNAIEASRVIEWDKDYICFLAGSFIFGDFFEALCFEKLLKPTAIYITTLGMSKNNVDSIVNMVDFLGVKQVNLVISHYFAGVERHNIIPYMEQEFKGKPIDFAVLQSHCKIALICSPQGDCLISGSANLSSSNNVEQIMITHSQSAIDFIKQKLDKVMQKFTVYKGLDGAKMDWAKNKGNTGKKAFEALK